MKPDAVPTAPLQAQEDVTLHPSRPVLATVRPSIASAIDCRVRLDRNGYGVPWRPLEFARASVCKREQPVNIVILPRTPT